MVTDGYSLESGQIAFLSCVDGEEAEVCRAAPDIHDENVGLAVSGGQGG